MTGRIGKSWWLYVIYRTDGSVFHAAAYELDERAALKFGARIPAHRRGVVGWKRLADATAEERAVADKWKRAAA